APARADRPDRRPDVRRARPLGRVRGRRTGRRRGAPPRGPPVSAVAPARPGTGARPLARDLTGDAAGSLGMGVWVTVPGLLLLYFMTHTLGVSPFLAGLTLLLPKIVDAVAHPLFGTLSDRQARRAGHRRGMLRWGLLLALAWIGL